MRFEAAEIIVPLSDKKLKYIILRAMLNAIHIRPWQIDAAVINNLGSIDKVGLLVHDFSKFCATCDFIVRISSRVLLNYIYMNKPVSFQRLQVDPWNEIEIHIFWKVVLH